jgi:hypothetical protein
MPAQLGGYYFFTRLYLVQQNWKVTDRRPTGGETDRSGTTILLRQIDRQFIHTNGCHRECTIFHLQLSGSTITDPAQYDDPPLTIKSLLGRISCNDRDGVW